MNKTTEALKMAIEYLTNIQLDYKGHEVRKACKEALEQPAQEPDRTGMVYYKNNACKAKDANSPDCICWTPEQPAPKNCTSLDDFIAELEKDPEFKEVMKQQRAKLLALLESPQPAQEPVAWMRSALDNARDVCKYLDHDMIKEAKAHTKFFWNDIEKIKEPDTHPAPSFIGLNDDEMMEIWCSDEVESTLDFGRAIEQALKEKNT